MSCRGNYKGLSRGPALVAVLVAALLAGCGSGAEDTATVPPPSECVDRWNAAPESKVFGRHVYNEHDSRQGRVTIEAVAKNAFNIKSDETCTAVFAVPPTDDEYGDVGLAVTRLGWASMRELDRRDADRLDALQAEAAAAPNVNVFPDGTIEAR